MSETAPDGVYVYQPHSPRDRKDGRLWHIGGLPTGMTKEEAEAVAEAINDICWLMSECHACGHALRFASDHCPQCSARAVAPWRRALAAETAARGPSVETPKRRSR